MIATQPILPESRGDLMPARLLDLELSLPLAPALAALDADGRPYERAVALVRLHTRPLGRVELQMADCRLTVESCARQIWAALAPAIIEHLAADGRPAPAALDGDGLAAAEAPRCLQERAALLADAPWASVVVATHNRPEGLRACLESLLAQDYPRFDIIVVDNAPANADAQAVVEGLSGGPVRLRYVREERPGLACAHNRGMLEVQAPLVAFTDDDVQVDRYWLAELVLGFRAGPNVGCVTGMIWPAELETPSQLLIENTTGFNKGFRLRIFDLGEHRVAAPLFPLTAGVFGSGASMAFRSDVLRAMGGFDPALGAGSVAQGGDDLAAFFNVVARGLALVYQPAAVLHHWHRRDYTALQRQVYGYGVGLTAYLASALAANPRWLFHLAGRLPQAVSEVLSPQSALNARKGIGYPDELRRRERQGMLRGPLAYLNSRWRYREAPRLQAASQPQIVLDRTAPPAGQEIAAR